MPNKAPTPCPRCHTLGPCPHRGAARRHRNTPAWRRTSSDIIAEHIAEHGWTCPGYGDHEPHESHDLTVHHVDPLHGHGETGQHVVLCRQANSAFGA